MLIGAIITVSLVVIGGILFVIYPLIKKETEDKLFFKRVYSTVYKIAVNKDLYLINDVELKVENKLVHFNQILFGDKYIYCIGNSYRKYPLSGQSNDAQWLEYESLNKINYIDNPLLLHKQRVEYFKSVIKSDDIVVGVYLVNDSCILDKSINNDNSKIVIVNESDLDELVNKFEHRNVSPINAEQLKKLVLLINEKNQKKAR